MKQYVIYFLLLITYWSSAQKDTSFLITRLQEARIFFPELEDVSIEIAFGKGTAPFTTRPIIGTKRRYRITISEEVKPAFFSIRFENLSPNAQIGVLCHELAHVSQFNTFSSRDWIRYLMHHMISRKVDCQENKTDRLVISHGAGLFLYTWSQEVRDLLCYENWNGTRLRNSNRHERYLNPISILAIMCTQTDYKYPVFVF